MISGFDPLASTSFLYMLMLLPIILLAFKKFRRQKIQRTTDLAWQKKARKINSWPVFLSHFFLVLAGFLILGFLFLPEFKIRPKEESISAREILLVVDNSGSMKLASQRPDAAGASEKPLENIELARLLTQDLLEKRTGDWFGEIFFSDEASFVRTFTSDPRQILSIFEDRKALYFLAGATNIHLGLLEAKNVLSRVNPPQKIVVLISDLEDIPDQTLAVLNSMLKEGFYVAVVAMDRQFTSIDDIMSGYIFQVLGSVIENQAKSGETPNLYFLELASKEDLPKVSENLNAILDGIPAWEIKIDSAPEKNQKTKDWLLFSALGFLTGWIVLNFLYPKVP